MELGFWTYYLVLASACLLCFTVHQDDKSPFSILARIVDAMVFPLFMGVSIHLFDRLVRVLA